MIPKELVSKDKKIEGSRFFKNLTLRFWFISLNCLIPREVPSTLNQHLAKTKQLEHRFY